MVRNAMPLEAKSYRIVVADEYQATFYLREKKFSPMQEVASLRNEAAREKRGDLLADKSGRAFDSHGQGRHAMIKESADPKTQSAIVFAKEISERLADDKRQRQFDCLVVIAAPRFLGLLRQALDNSGVEIDMAIDKEVTGKDGAFIQKMLDDAWS